MLLGSCFFFLTKTSTLFLPLLLEEVSRERKREKGMGREEHWGDGRERDRTIYGVKRRGENYKGRIKNNYIHGK